MLKSPRDTVVAPALFALTLAGCAPADSEVTSNLVYDASHSFGNFD